MFRYDPTKDPRAALFGLSLFNHAHPGFEHQLEFFANVLEATRNSLSIIRGEVKNFETSMNSLALQPKTEFSTQPVHQPKEEDAVSSYTNPNYAAPSSQSQSYQSTVETMDVKSNELKRSLERIIEENPNKMNEFLDELEQLINKYR